jgi:hypothetical protein
VLWALIAFGILGFWFSRILPGPLWGFLTIFVSLTSGLLGDEGTQNLATPDALSVVLTLVATFLLVEKRKTVPACIILIFSQLVRPDNIVLALLVMIYFTFAGPRPYSMRLRTLALLLGASLGVHYSVALWSGSYGWQVLFVHSFIDFLTAPRDFAPELTLATYLLVLKSAVFTELIAQKSAPFMGVLMTLTFAAAPPKFRKGDVYSHLLLVLFMATVVRFLLFPAWADRYFVFLHLMVVMTATVILYKDSRQFSSGRTSENRLSHQSPQSLGARSG